MYIIISTILTYEWWYFQFTDKETGPGGKVTQSYMDSKNLKYKELNINLEYIGSKSSAISISPQKPNIRMALRQVNYNIVGD